MELYVCGNVSHAEKLAEKQIYSQKDMYKKMTVLNISQESDGDARLQV